MRLGVGTAAICPPAINAAPTPAATTGKPRALKNTNKQQTNKQN